MVEESLTCPHCGKEMTEGPFYFKRPVHSLIDLMQSAYHLETLSSGDGRIVSFTSKLDQCVAVLMSFCQLTDVVFEQFLIQLMMGLRLPPNVAKRLLADHETFNKRAIQLLPSLTGRDLQTIVDSFRVESGVDYLEALTFGRKAKRRKKSFMRTGDSTGIDSDLARSCILHTSPVLELFSALHNLFIPKIRFKQDM